MHAVPPSGSLAVPVPPPLVTPRFLRLLLTQTAFSVGWSLYLVMPKYFTLTLGADAQTVGRLQATGALVSAACIPLIGRAVDRLGRKPVFRLGTLALVTMSVGYPFVDHVGPALFLLQCLGGPAFVLTFNASATLATEDAPPERIGHAIGLLGASNLVMNGVSTALAEALADNFGWNAVFALGTLAGLCSFALSFGVYERVRSADEQASAAAASWPFASTWPLLVASALAGVGFCAVFIFHQPYALSLGATHVRNFFIGFTVTALVARTVLGNLGDRHGRLRVSFYAAIGYVLTGAAMVRMDPSFLVFYGALFGAAHGVLYPTLNAAVMERVTPAQRGRAMALYNGAFNVGAGLASLGWGALAVSHGYSMVFAGATVVSLVAAICLRR
jgi:MFS family permease